MEGLEVLMRVFNDIHCQHCLHGFPHYLCLAFSVKMHVEAWFVTILDVSIIIVTSNYENLKVLNVSVHNVNPYFFLF